MAEAPPQPRTDAVGIPAEGDAAAEAARIAEIGFRSDHVGARPGDTQMFLAADAAVRQAVLSLASVDSGLDIALIPACPDAIAADTLDLLHRRLATRGVAVARLWVGETDERRG